MTDKQKRKNNDVSLKPKPIYFWCWLAVGIVLFAIDTYHAGVLHRWYIFDKAILFPFVRLGWVWGIGYLIITLFGILVALRNAQRLIICLYFLFLPVFMCWGYISLFDGTLHHLDSVQFEQQSYHLTLQVPEGIEYAGVGGSGKRWYGHYDIWQCDRLSVVCERVETSQPFNVLMCNYSYACLMRYEIVHGIEREELILLPDDSGFRVIITGKHIRGSFEYDEVILFE